MGDFNFLNDFLSHFAMIFQSNYTVLIFFLFVSITLPLFGDMNVAYKGNEMLYEA